MQFFISAEEGKKKISNFGRKRKYLMCLCNISSTSRSMFVGGSMAANPIYPMALVIFYWLHIPNVREN
jgi:hypothetical protein